MNYTELNNPEDVRWIKSQILKNKDYLLDEIIDSNILSIINKNNLIQYIGKDIKYMCSIELNLFDKIKNNKKLIEYIRQRNINIIQKELNDK